MNSFHEQHKKWYALFVLCALIAGLSGYYAFGETNPLSKYSSPLVQEETPQTNKDELNQIKNKETSEVVEDEKENTLVPKNTNPALPPTQTNETAPTESNTSSSTPSEKTPLSQETSQKDLIQATLKVQGAIYSAKIPKESSVLSFMSIIKAEQGLSFQTKDFGGGLGLFIEKMNGIKNGDKREHYWIYYINGAKAQIGISNYILKNNDIITWKYEAFEI